MGAKIQNIITLMKTHGSGVNKNERKSSYQNMSTGRQKERGLERERAHMHTRITQRSHHIYSGDVRT